MARRIKHLKPNENSRYKQGYFTPQNPGKYVRASADEPIIYRSSLELKLMHMCDNSTNIVKWSSENLEIPYVFDGRQHTYNIDFLIQTVEELWLVEVKPMSQVKVPHRNASDADKMLYLKNRAKWDAATKFAAGIQNCSFKIITENFFK
jgi:hypothetical protein